MRKIGQDVGEVAEAPSPCLTGRHQIPNNIQIPISNDPKQVILDFGHSVIGKLLALLNMPMITNSEFLWTFDEEFLFRTYYLTGWRIWNLGFGIWSRVCL